MSNMSDAHLLASLRQIFLYRAKLSFFSAFMRADVAAAAALPSGVW